MLGVLALNSHTGETYGWFMNTHIEVVNTHIEVVNTHIEDVCVTHT